VLCLRSFSSTSPGSNARVGEGTFGKSRIDGSTSKFETRSPLLNADSKRQAEMELEGSAKGQWTQWFCWCGGIAMFDRLRPVWLICEFPV
jgi:hypothetical protein